MLKHNNKQTNSIKNKQKYRVVGKKEVISPTLTIKVIGFFTILVLSFFLFKVRQFRACGLKLYILNKMKNTFFKPDASFAFYPEGLSHKCKGLYNKATLRTLCTLLTLWETEGKKNNTYNPTILNKNTLKNINKFKVRLYYSDQLNIRDSLNLPDRLGLIKNQRKYYHISNIRAVNIIGQHNEEVLSVIIGSLLVDGCSAQPLYIKNSFTTLINLPLNPNWITGFTDAEGSFKFSITISENRAIRWRVTPIFSIELHGNDLQLLSKIQSFFCVGNITTRNKNGQVVYSVKSIVDINFNSIIIPHFYIYHLLLFALRPLLPLLLPLPDRSKTRGRCPLLLPLPDRSKTRGRTGFLFWHLLCISYFCLRIMSFVVIIITFVVITKAKANAIVQIRTTGVRKRVLW